MFQNYRHFLDNTVKKSPPGITRNSPENPPKIPRQASRENPPKVPRQASRENPPKVPRQASRENPPKVPRARRPEKIPRKSPARRPGGFEIRRKKRFDLLNRGICNPPINNSIPDCSGLQIR